MGARPAANKCVIDFTESQAASHKNTLCICEGGRVWGMKCEKVSIIQSFLYHPANDDQDIIDTQQHDSLSTREIITAIQPT